ncbi:MAG: DMT family transporter [Clostridiaceae bacterium]
MDPKAKIISSMLIFGSIGVFVKGINLTSLEIAFIRAVIGSIFLILSGYILKQKISMRAIKKNGLLLLLSGGFIGLNWIFLFQAYKYTTIQNATLSYYFAPVFVMLLSPFVLKEKLTAIKVSCIIAAMIGLFLILNGGTVNNYSFENNLIGIVYGLSGAGLYASVILMNKFIKDLSSFETTLIQLMMAAIILLPFVLFQSNFSIFSISYMGYALILIVGIVHTGIAYLLYFTSMKDLNGQSIAVLSYIDPISAVILSSIFLNETMSFSQIIGGVFILGSTFLSDRVDIFSKETC